MKGKEIGQQNAIAIGRAKQKGEEYTVWQSTSISHVFFVAPEGQVVNAARKVWPREDEK